MLLSYLTRTEKVLNALSGVVTDAGHSDHKGTPREFFVSYFLEQLVGQGFGIGSGEIIDETSKPGEQRPQIDIIIYDKHFPKLSLGGGIHAFFAESVIATIEVKSTLTDEKLKDSLDSIRAIKALKQNRIHRTHDFHPSGIVSYVFAYTGPAKIETSFTHLKTYIQNNKVQMPALAKTFKERSGSSIPMADFICVLGNGAIQYDNAIHDTIKDDERAKNPKLCWILLEKDALFWLYLHLTGVLLTYSPDGLLNPWPYLARHKWKWTFSE